MPLHASSTPTKDWATGMTLPCCTAPPVPSVTDVVTEAVVIRFCRSRLNRASVPLGMGATNHHRMTAQKLAPLRRTQCEGRARKGQDAGQDERAGGQADEKGGLGNGADPGRARPARRFTAMANAPITTSRTEAAVADRRPPKGKGVAGSLRDFQSRARAQNGAK